MDFYDFVDECKDNDVPQEDVLYLWNNEEERRAFEEEYNSDPLACAGLAHHGMTMSDLINLYLYYDEMVEHFWNTDWSNETDYVKYCQFVWLSNAMLREIEIRMESEVI